jgi:XTP/dITP diphosphohydrolase
MVELIFATHNSHKAAEIEAQMPDGIRVVALSALDKAVELPETHKTLEGNAAQKADGVWAAFGRPCFADDTGLMVEALAGAPGVHSARYAGPEADAGRNIDKLLNALTGLRHRTAHFVTVVCLVWEGERRFFHGMLSGDITHQPRGEHGFGYDPVFQPQGHQQTLAEMSQAEKNRISHRTKAFQQLTRFLRASA